MQLMESPLVVVQGEEVETVEFQRRATGHLEYTAQRSRGAVLADLKAILGNEPDGAEEYFELSSRGSAGEAFPPGTIQVVVKRGGSEGYYVYVQVVDWETGVTPVFLGKSLGGGEASWRLAQRLEYLLQEW